MTIKIDLKGVIQNPADSKLIPGSDEALKVLKEKGNTIVIMATDADEAKKWLDDNKVEYDEVKKCSDADLIISANAMGFRGSWEEWIMSEIAEFEPYYKRQEREQKDKSLEAGYTRGEAWKAERDGDKEKAKKLRKEVDNMFGIGDDEPVEVNKSDE